MTAIILKGVTLCLLKVLLSFFNALEVSAITLLTKMIQQRGHLRCRNGLIGLLFGINTS